MDRNIQEEKSSGVEGRDWNYSSAGPRTEDYCKHQKLGADCPLEPLEETNFAFRLLASRVMREYIYLFKPASFGYFVTETLGN